MALQKIELGTTSAAACCGGDGYSCDLPAFAADAVLTELKVDGMTCDHCVRAVTEGLTALDGVDEVSVALVPGGTSRLAVRSSGPLDESAARAAIADAGYSVAG